MPIPSLAVTSGALSAFTVTVETSCKMFSYPGTRSPRSSGGANVAAVAVRVFIQTCLRAARQEQGKRLCFCQLHLAHFDALIWPTLGVSSAPWGLPLPGPAAPGGRRV